MIAELKNIGLSISGQTILNNINLSLKKGEITTLIGPNGGGKTSIARILLNIMKPTSGKVVKDSKIRIGYMPQQLIIEKTIPLTVREFLLLSQKKIKFTSEILDLAKQLKIENILDKQIHNLSGGQLQKILFLRSIINKPNLLVLDEPTQYMDVSGIEDFYQIIDQFRKNHECSILLISHDLHMVMQKTDVVFCINNHVCCHGSPESINQHPEYISLFGKRSKLAIYQHHHNHQH